MVAGVKADRCRSCAEGTLSEGFWLVEEVGHASHPSLSDWLAVFVGQLKIYSHTQTHSLFLHLNVTTTEN